MNKYKALHILHVPSWYPNKKKPGEGIFIKRHIQLISKLYKCSVIYVCFHDEKFNEVQKIEEENFLEIIFYLKKRNGILKLLKPLDILLAYLQGLKLSKNKFGNTHLIHHHVFSIKSIFALLLKIFTKNKLIYSEQWSGFYPEDGRFNGIIQKTIFKLLTRNATYISAVSKSLKNAMKKHSSNSNFSVIPNLVDVSKFSVKQNFNENGKIKILHVSALNDKEKNITGILNAFSKSLKIKNNLWLTLVGEYDEKQKFIDFANSLNILSNTEFKGYISPENLNDEYHKADFFLMFSNFETFSCVLAEAVYCGLPVISANNGGMTDFLNKKNALLINPKDEDALCSAIIYMSENFRNYSFASQHNSILDYIDNNKILNQFNDMYLKALE